MRRDRRFRTSAIVSPIIISIMMVGLFGIIGSSISKTTKHTIFLVVNSSGNPLVGQWLKSSESLDVKTLPDVATGERLIKKGDARLVIDVEPPGASKQATINLMFDPKEDSAQVTKAQVAEQLQQQIFQLTQNELKNRGLPASLAQPFVVKDDPIKVGEGGGAGAVVVSILPYLIVIFTFSGAFSIASDMVAGEKEKSTLETLLITPVRRTEIVIGKFLALCTASLLGSISSVVGLFVATELHLPGADTMFAGGLGLTPKCVAVILISVVPLLALFSGLLLAVSSFARNVREAQTYLSMLYLVVIMPAVFSQVIGYTDFEHATWVNFVPILNTANNIRSAFLGKANWTAVFEALAVGVVLAALAIRLAVYMFNREQVLART